jgi:hypothetical protein
MSTLRWTRRKEASGKVSASMAEWSARATRRRLNMNANVTTGIRELTAQELDQVTGGTSLIEGMSNGEAMTFGFVISGLIAGAAYGLGCLIDWLFG